jgi:hypothetical protein
MWSRFSNKVKTSKSWIECECDSPCVPVQISASEVLIVRTCHLVSMFNESIIHNNNGKILLLAKWVLARRLCTRRLCTSSFLWVNQKAKFGSMFAWKFSGTKESVLHSIFLDFSKGYMTTWLELVKKSQLGPPWVKRPKTLSIIHFMVQTTHVNWWLFIDNLKNPFLSHWDHLNPKS